MESDNVEDKIILAPMVRGSELAFRSLVRQQGGLTSAAYSPMVRADEVIHAFRIWSETSTHELSQPIIDNDMHDDGILLLEDIMTDTDPLVVQLCGCSPTALYQACQVLLKLNQPPHHCQIQGIDLNLGCPQICARVGTFGAFLAEGQPVLALQCVAAMRQSVDDFFVQYPSHQRQPVPTRLSCKIRLRDDLDDTIGFARQIQHAGCDMLTVHCRRKEEQHYSYDGPPDYAAGAAIVAALDIPVVINGNVCTVEDAREILTITQAHAIMVARGFLRNPLLLMTSTNSGMSTNNIQTSPVFLASAYLDHAERCPPPSPLYIRNHLRWIFRAALKPKERYPSDYSDWRIRMWTFLVRPYLETIYQFRQVVALYARLSNDNMRMPPSLAELPEGSFQSIRHNVEYYLEDDDTAEEGGLALGLFG